MSSFHAQAKQALEQARVKVRSAETTQERLAAIAVLKDLYRAGQELLESVAQLAPWLIVEALREDPDLDERHIDGPYGESKMRGLAREAGRPARRGGRARVAAKT